ncbi:MAG: single-stranded-DNA-specific exonuclease RecJ [Clostridia bacterium]|nr:single-stranded-DNA-specific exonuclease RecJ [Clostridia bacterium]
MRFVKRNFSDISPSFVMECAKEFDITPSIMEQIILRGNDTKQKITEFLKPTTNSFHNPFLLCNMQKFVDRVNLAIEKKERILIFGDYDVDGVSATAIMLKTLKILGVNAKFYLPNRYVDGYGLTNAVIEKIKTEFNPDLIITVDCGISCYQEVEFAKTLGIEILITDHHEIPEILPNTIVLNAKLPNQEYKFNGLCGTGLAYKIAEALIGEKAEFLLPIACIATIADIVPLVDENRAIVYFGLKKLSLLPIGIKHLFKQLNVSISKCTANEISYKIAPKLNASGRMGDAKDSLKLYLSENISEIKVLIEKILNHNTNRRDLCSLVENDCGDILSKINLSAPSIIMSSKDWDQGILGIICAKLVSQYNRPVFLFSEVDGELKGSARSIKGINVHTLLASMQDILETYGGHPVAAGLTLKTENFDNFIYRVNNFLFENYEQDLFIPQENYDIEVKIEDITPKFIKDLQCLEPCGCDNETPKLFIDTNNFIFSPMKNFSYHCNIKIGGKLSLVNFNCANDYSKLKIAGNIKVVFEMQNDKFGSGLKGIVKHLDCDLSKLKNFSKNSTLPYLEQIRYLSTQTRAKFNFYNQNETNLFDTKSCFGTAFVVNSDFGYKVLLNKCKLEKLVKLDVCHGTENSGHNCVFVYPSSIEFARSYNKIIFLDSVVDFSYIAKINQISNAEIFLPNMKYQASFFKKINLSRENFAVIYKDIEKLTNQYPSILDIYLNLKKIKNIAYSYKEFYCAFIVFLELKFISFNKSENAFLLKITNNQKSDLSNSKIYNTLQILSK